MSDALPAVVTDHKRAALGGLVVVAGYLYWTRGRHGGAAAPALTTLEPVPADSGGAAGTGTSGIPASGTVTNETTPITTNAQWETAAIDYLVSVGTNAGFAQTAISKALAGSDMTPGEQAAVALAIAALHNPPEGMPPIGKGPTPGPGPTPSPYHAAGKTDWWKPPTNTTWTALAAKFAIPGGENELKLYHVSHGGDPLLLKSETVPAGHWIVYPLYVK